MPAFAVGSGGIGMRVLVTGGRDYGDVRLLTKTLDSILAIHPEMVVIHGACKTRDRATGAIVGADHLADCWAEAREVDCFKFPAKWKAYEKAAGPIRNKRMIDEGKPDLVVAFPGGRGTADMVKKAKAAGITVEEVAKP
jgi:hypothetical protein